MPLRLASTAGTDANTECPAGRGCTVFGVPRSAAMPTSQDAKGATATTASAPRQSVAFSARPARPRHSAYPALEAAIISPMPRARRSRDTLSPTSASTGV